MTDSTAQPDDFAGMLAERVRAEMADRQRNIRRGIAAGLVVLLHILAISVFVYSNQVPIIERIRQTIPEAIMWIPMPKPAQPRHEQPPPQPDIMTPEVTAPITLPHVRTQPQVEAPEEPGGLLGIGRSLSCLAGSFEYLSARQQERCFNKRPWNFIKKPDGTIVLMPLPKNEPERPTAAEVMRHQQETAPPCPLLTNTPCLGKIMHGDPLGGSPSPF